MQAYRSMYLDWDSETFDLHTRERETGKEERSEKRGREGGGKEGRNRERDKIKILPRDVGRFGKKGERERKKFRALFWVVADL